MSPTSTRPATRSDSSEQVDITWLRVLLAADVLTRAAELQKVKVLTVPSGALP